MILQVHIRTIFIRKSAKCYIPYTTIPACSLFHYNTYTLFNQLHIVVLSVICHSYRHLYLYVIVFICNTL